MPIDFYHVSLKAVIRREDGKILGLNGKRGGKYEGFYDLPGGRIDVEEFTLPFHDIITREVREEVGGMTFTLDPNPVAIGRHEASDHVRVLYVLFPGRTTPGIESIRVSDEHEGYAWLDVEETTVDKYFTSGLREAMKMFLGMR